MQIANKRNSIYVQLLQLLLIAAAVAMIFFQIINRAGEYLLENYLENSQYVENQNLRYLSRMQAYATENNLSSDDIQSLNKWIQNQKIVYVRIYEDDFLIYDSDYPNEDLSIAEAAAEKYSWESYYVLELSDKNLDVMISGNFSYQLYNWILVGSICISFVIFLTLVLMGIRKKMYYISRLCEEISILKGGSLDYEITVKGSDELAMLAEEIDNMRLVFKELMKKENELMKENQKIVTEMSHDIRTPVTAILLYSEILKKSEYKTEEKWLECVNKIDKKAHRLKQLTDNLFEYSLVSGDGDCVLDEPDTLEGVFYDLFSETCAYLEQRGFSVDFSAEWKPCKVRISMDYVMRIMDNITSNIIKYADVNFPITIKNIEENDKIGFVIENKICTTNEKVESYGIGIQSIKNMMVKMKGECITKTVGSDFQIILLFPYIE